MRITARRNTRLRAVLDGTRLASATVDVYADLPAKLQRLQPGGARPRVRLTVTAPRHAAIRRHAVSFYLARRGATTWRRVDRARWHALPRRRIVAVGTYPAGRLGRRDRVLACTPEPRSDGFGRPSPVDRSCGRKRLPAQATTALMRPR
jgi:hypothetical protein